MSFVGVCVLEKIAFRFAQHCVEVDWVACGYSAIDGYHLTSHVQRPVAALA